MIATSRSPQAQWSTVPSSIHGQSWNGLADERQ